MKKVPNFSVSTPTEVCINIQDWLLESRLRLQFSMDTMLGDLYYATDYLDDILVTSKTMAEHRIHKINVFEKLQEYGFKVRWAKCDFFLPEIKYLGHIIKRDGRRPDPERANAIRNMPASDNVQALQSFLGQANFYRGFIKNSQNLRGPL